MKSEESQSMKYNPEMSNSKIKQLLIEINNLVCDSKTMSLPNGDIDEAKKDNPSTVISYVNIVRQLWSLASPGWSGPALVH